MKSVVKHPMEAADSFATYLERTLQKEGDETESNAGREDGNFLRQGHRNLKHHHHHNTQDLEMLAEQQEVKFLEKQKADLEAEKEKARKKREKHEAKLWRDSGIQDETVHGMMIDAGSGGSRLHLFEWEPRVLRTPREVDAAVSGKKLTYPGTDSRWTDRLSPGLSSFATLPDDELEGAIAEYLTPLVDFAMSILHTKEDEFANFPIYLRATAGMRVLEQSDRFRVMDAVRSFFSNDTLCPFQFVPEHARVISGEEEAIYGWAGINFAMGTLIQESEGTGTVLNPRLTYGALDMGGASTQLSFYEPNGDIMSNLFKLQIGQGKHWNLYAHSFLHYGINEAKDRLDARLISDKDAKTRLTEGVYNPCLPGGAEKLVRTAIYFDSNGIETWDRTTDDADSDGFRQGIVKNTNKGGDGAACMALAKAMLHKEDNEWCNFSHRGDCSFAGVYQPDLPKQSRHFGEFLAFSNFYHVWDFLNLPMRSSLADLQNRTLYACSLNERQLLQFNNGRIPAEQVNDFCFHSSFVFEVLHNGYGFGMDDYITATNVVNSQKVGWALGAMMYEINTVPWLVVDSKHPYEAKASSNGHVIFFLAVVLGMLGSVIFIFLRRCRKTNRSEYEPINRGRR